MKKLKSRVHLHNYYLEGMAQIGKKIKLICKSREGYKIFIANKVILAAGTIATTKIVMEFLKVKHEVKIKHHPRLLSVYFSK